MCSVVGSPWGLDDPKESLLGFGDEGRDSGELIGVSLEARLEWIGAMATSGPPSLPLDVLPVCCWCGACSAEVSVGMTAEQTGTQARLPSTTVACASVECACLYRRVSTRVRFGVWSPDGRSTPVPPSLVADP